VIITELQNNSHQQKNSYQLGSESGTWFVASQVNLSPNHCSQLIHHLDQFGPDNDHKMMV